MQTLVEHLNIVIFGLTVVFAWGAFRAGGVRDDEGRKLPPSVFSGVYLGLIYTGIYLGLLLLAYSSPGLMEGDSWINLLPFAKSLIQEGQLPLLMLILLYGVHSVPQVKDLERLLVIRMHTINDRSAEQRELRNYFVRCGYKPTPEAAERHMEFLRQFDLHLTDREPTQLGLGASNSWAKVTSILEILYEHMADADTTFSSEEKDQIRRLDLAHRRKTELATNLFRMVQHMDEQPAYDARLTRVAGLLGDAEHQDRESVAVAETIAGEILRGGEQARAQDPEVGGGEPVPGPGAQNQGDQNLGGLPAAAAVAEGPVNPVSRISATELRRYAGSVERYFSAEYELLLEEASGLGAKAIARAGDHSDEKMRELKAAGFEELGSIQQVNIDRLMLVVLVSVIAPLAIYYFIGEYTGVGTTRPAVLVTVALTLAVAVFVAAISGTRRKLAQARETPWRSYFVAGFIAMLCAVAIFGGRQAIRESERQEAFRQKVLEIVVPNGAWAELSEARQQAFFEQRSPEQERQARELLRVERRSDRQGRSDERAAKSSAAQHLRECRQIIREERQAERARLAAATGDTARASGGSSGPQGRPRGARSNPGSAEFWTRALPWSAGSFVVVLTMCWLIRQPSWSIARGSSYAERTIDGLVLGLTYGLAALATYKVFSLTGSGFGKMIDCTYAQGFWDVPAILFARSGLVGFVIAAVVIRDLREVANARVIDPYVSRRGQRLATAPTRA